MYLRHMTVFLTQSVLTCWQDAVRFAVKGD